MSESSTPIKKSRITLRSYILLASIGILLASNGFLIYKYNKERTEVQMRDELQRQAIKQEIENMDMQLKTSKVVMVKLEHLMEEERTNAEKRIALLKTKFSKQQEFSSQELQNAKNEILSLRQFLTTYQLKADSLQKINALLNHQLNNAGQKIKNLSQLNNNLNKEVKKGVYFQIHHIHVAATRFNKKEQAISTKKAKYTEVFDIELELLPNPTVVSKKYPVFFRIFDPLGNLIAENQDVFTINSETLQYSLMTYIDYQNNRNGLYHIRWNNPKAFEKGEYTLLVYGLQKMIAETHIILK